MITIGSWIHDKTAVALSIEKEMKLQSNFKTTRFIVYLEAVREVLSELGGQGRYLVLDWGRYGQRTVIQIHQHRPLWRIIIWVMTSLNWWIIFSSNPLECFTAVGRNFGLSQYNHCTGSLSVALPDQRLLSSLSLRKGEREKRERKRESERKWERKSDGNVIDVRTRKSASVLAVRTSILFLFRQVTAASRIGPGFCLITFSRVSP